MGITAQRIDTHIDIANRRTTADVRIEQRPITRELNLIPRLNVEKLNRLRGGIQILYACVSICCVATDRDMMNRRR